MAKRLFGFLTGREPADGRASPEPSGLDAETDVAWTPDDALGPAPLEPPPRAAAAVPAVPAGSGAGSAALDFAASVRHLPFFSGTATQLMSMIGRDDVSGKELAALIATDAGLVAHLLRIVNSPYYGVSRRVATVADTLAVLGVDQVRRLVTASVVQRPPPGIQYDAATLRAHWRHGLVCAALARHVAGRRRLDAEVAYMAGLVHDVGRLAMLIRFPEYESLLQAGLVYHASTVDEEVDSFGFDHAQAGGALLQSWGLPGSIVDAVLLHESAEEPSDPLGACVWLANGASHELEGDLDGEVETVTPWMERLDLARDQLRVLRDEIRALESGGG